MAKLTIDTGAAGNPATGDTLRTAMAKVNANFTEIYNELGSDGTFSNIGFTGNSIISDDTNGDIILDPNGSGSIVVDATIRNRATNANIVISPNGTGALDVDTSRIINVTDPTSAQDAATKAYVDTQVSGVSPTTFVGDDSTGTSVNPGETFKFAGTQNITTAVSGDTLTITGPDLSSYATQAYVDARDIGDLSVVGSTISAPSNATLTLTTSGTGNISLFDNTSVQGTLGVSSDITVDGTFNRIGDFTFSGTSISSGSSTAININEQLNVDGALSVGGNITGTFAGTMDADTATVSNIEVDNFKASTIVLESEGIASNDNDTTLPTSAAVKDYVDAQVGGVSPTTFVGDDSTGTAVNPGETFKIAGTQNITTAVSGDTLTITGPDLSSYATQSYVTSQGYITNSTTTIVGDDSTGTTINSGETFKIAGTQNITTAVSGDTLTITGPDLSSYLTSETSHADVLVDGDFASAGFMKTDGAGTYSIDANTYLTSVAFGDLTSTPTTLSGYGITDAASSTATAVTVVGDDSTGTAVTLGETFKIAGTQNVSTAVSGDTLTITGPDLTSYLTTVAFADLTSKPTTLSGYGITDAASSTTTALTVVGDDSTGTAITLGETFKIAGAGTVTTAVSGDTITITGAAGDSVGDLTITGSTIISPSNADITLDPSGTGNVIVNSGLTGNALSIKEVYENLNSKTGATGTVTHDLSTGHIFYHTSISANFTANFTNIDTTANQATTATLVLVQGATAYIPNAVQIGGVAKTINWQGGTPPSGTNNGIDVVTFSIIDVSGTYTVLGQLTDF